MSTILELNNIKKAYDVKMAVDIDKLVIEEGCLLYTSDAADE